MEKLVCTGENILLLYTNDNHVSYSEKKQPKKNNCARFFVLLDSYMGKCCNTTDNVLVFLNIFFTKKSNIQNCVHSFYMTLAQGKTWPTVEWLWSVADLFRSSEHINKFFLCSAWQRWSLQCVCVCVWCVRWAVLIR